MLKWIGRSILAVGVALWLSFCIVASDMEGRRLRAPSSGHTFAYGGHSGLFYVDSTDLALLRLLMFGGVGLFVAGGFIQLLAAAFFPKR